jgi:tetratricopeptide (TPR) repeat protein
MRRLGWRQQRRWWPAGWLCAGLLWIGCAKPPQLPSDLARAQLAERGDGQQQAVGEYEAIVASCRKQPRPEPKDPCGTAALRRAQLLEQTAQPAAAAAAYLEVRSLSSDGQTIARALLRAALLYAGPLGQPATALSLCRQVVPRWPDEVAAEDALRLLVDLQTAAAADLGTELGQLAESLRSHEIIASFALFYRAGWLLKNGQPGPAIAAYDAIWQRYPRGPLFDDALFGAAQLLRQQHQPAAAAQRLLQLEASFSKAMLIGHYNKLLLDEGALLLGQIYLGDLGQPGLAITTLESFVRRQPSSLLCDDALLLMAEAALRQHQPATAADHQQSCQYLRRLRRQYPDGNRRRRADEQAERLGCPP